MNLILVSHIWELNPSPKKELTEQWPLTNECPNNRAPSGARKKSLKSSPFFCIFFGKKVILSTRGKKGSYSGDDFDSDGTADGQFNHSYFEGESWHRG